MKTLFALTVIAAVIYLFFPAEYTEKLGNYLPQHKIEQAAKQLLSQVDEKINRVKQQLLSKKDDRIAVLEDKMIKLQTQLQQQQQPQLSIKQTVNGEQPATPVLNGNFNNTYLTHSDLTKISPSAKQQQNINKQAALKDITDRMNKTSLLAAYE